MMDAHELACLGQVMLASCRGSELTAVEIGAFVGQTTAFCLELLRANGVTPHWITVDPFEFLEDADSINPQGISTQFIANIKQSGMASCVSAIMTTSDRAVRLVPQNIDFLIVDGFHSYEICRSDLYNYMPRLRRGGGVLIDDYSTGYPGVVQAVEEFFGEHAEFQGIQKKWFV
jgi:hypothetical protein